MQVDSATVAKHPALEAGLARARQSKVWDCRCAKCGHAWTTLDDELPDYCPGCRKDTWWLKRPRGRPRLQLKAEMWHSRGPELQLDDEHAVQFKVHGPDDQLVVIRRKSLNGPWIIARKPRGGRRLTEEPTEYATRFDALKAFSDEYDD